jgi:hypothetical protein
VFQNLWRHSMPGFKYGAAAFLVVWAGESLYDALTKPKPVPHAPGSHGGTWASAFGGRCAVVRVPAVVSGVVVVMRTPACRRRGCRGGAVDIFLCVKYWTVSSCEHACCWRECRVIVTRTVVVGRPPV